MTVVISKRNIMEDLMRSITNSMQSFLGIDNEQTLALRALGRTKDDIRYGNILSTCKLEFEARWEKNEVKVAHLSDFVRLRTLGAGTYGTVVLMKHKENEGYYASKILRKERLVKMKQIKHTLHEKRILQSIRHPFVVHMEYFIMDNNNLYFVMPYVSGGELYTYMRRLSKFDERLAKFYAAQVYLGLEYLHTLDIVYRDLKPENVLLCSNGYLKLTDFGFAKVCKGRTYTLCGTPDYMAPEIILNKGHGKPVDWWSYGVMLFEMCAGQPPFHAEDLMDIYRKIVKAKYKLPSNFSSDLKDLVRNLLQVDSTTRFGNLKNGPYDIKKHAWFKTTDFRSLYEQTLDPPYKPLCKSAADSSNFIAYTKDAPQKVDSVDQFAEIFKDFL